MELTIFSLLFSPERKQFWDPGNFKTRKKGGNGGKM